MKKVKLKSIALLAFGLLLVSNLGYSQRGGAIPRVSNDTTGAAKDNLHLPLNTKKTTNHQVTIKGVKVDYEATVGTLPVWDNDGKVVASLFYVYYKRKNVKDIDNRPLVYSFNGGPGSGNVWMNIGFTGPKKLKISKEGFPVQPYGVEENPYSLLDAADIVYISPVNTAFSRIVDKDVDPSEFFGEEADIKYLADAIRTFTGRFDRWKSPKFLIGESYGTTRVSGLALALQESQWMYLNGVVLVSPTGLGIDRNGPVQEANLLPYYAAAAWYHNALSSDLQNKELEDMLPEVEDFTVNEYIPALVKAGSLPQGEKEAIASKVAQYSGISQKVILQHNLIIDRSFFWKELLRDRGYTVGRLDSRYLGMDLSDAGNQPDYNAELTAWNHSFTPAINAYMKEELEFDTDLQYYMFGPVHPWKGREKSYFNQGSAGMDLSKAMRVDAGLHLMVMSGYYDGATDYFNAKYNMWHINQNGKLSDRMEWHGFRSGHMMYLREDDLKSGNELLREFIKKSTPKVGEPIRYHDPKGKF